MDSVCGAPHEVALLQPMERTGYDMLQENGQRKYGPPPDWTGAAPPRGCEIFVGRIPRDCYEDELEPLLERCGKIYEFRLMMDSSGSNRGYCFATYTCQEDAHQAVAELNNHEIRRGRFLGVCMSVDNCRLFVGGIPKHKQQEEILEEMRKVTEGVIDVIVYPSRSDKTKNQGFAVIEYASHRAAAMARDELITGCIQLWEHQIAVDWAESEQDVDDDIMSKVLYVRNLMLSTPEATLDYLFNQAAGHDGAVERVTKLRDYAFIHFYERDDALRALSAIKGRLNPDLCILLKRYGEVSVGRVVSELQVNGCFMLDADEQTHRTMSQSQDTLQSVSKISPQLAQPELIPGTVVPSHGDGALVNSLTEHKLFVDDGSGVKPVCQVDLEDTDNVPGKATDVVVAGGSGGGHRGGGVFWSCFGKMVLSLLTFVLIWSIVLASMKVKTVAVILNVDPCTLEFWLKCCVYGVAALALSHFAYKLHCVLKFFEDEQTKLAQIIKNIEILTTTAVEYLRQHSFQELISVIVDNNNNNNN